jgi:hypothetical protein
MRFFLFAFLIPFFWASKDNFPPEEADAIYFNARVWTGDKSQPEAASIATKGNTIIYVGNNYNSVVVTIYQVSIFVMP